MLMPLPIVNKFCDMENARRVLGEPTLAEGWTLTGKGTYLVDTDAGFVKVQQWEVNAIYNMLDCWCAAIGEVSVLLESVYERKRKC